MARTALVMPRGRSPKRTRPRLGARCTTTQRPSLRAIMACRTTTGDIVKNARSGQLPNLAGSSPPSDTPRVHETRSHGYKVSQNRRPARQRAGPAVGIGPDGPQIAEIVGEVSTAAMSILHRRHRGCEQRLVLLVGHRQLDRAQPPTLGSSHGDVVVEADDQPAVRSAGCELGGSPVLSADVGRKVARSPSMAIRWFVIAWWVTIQPANTCFVCRHQASRLNVLTGAPSELKSQVNSSQNTHHGSASQFWVSGTLAYRLMSSTSSSRSCRSVMRHCRALVPAESSPVGALQRRPSDTVDSHPSGRTARLLPR